MSFQIAGLIEGQRRERFDVIGISLTPQDGSDIGERMKRAFDKFVDASTLDDEQTANLVHELEVDIAIDLNGHTQRSRTNVFARRPAPIQVNYMGFPGTTGAEYLDYVIADRTVVPAESASHFSEKMVWLPDTYWVTDRKLAVAAGTPSRTEAGLPEGAFVFCCFNQAYKILPDVFDCWMRILKRVDRSVLWLLEDSATAAGNLRMEAASRKVDPGRIIFAPRISTSEHLARQKCADLFLDTLPYNAHTTASDALWVELPVVTHIGQAFAGRVAASLLTAIGMPELIASTQDAYETLAVELATDPGKYAAIKEKLARNRLTMPLFDTPRFISNIEAAYTAMHQRYQNGLPPDHIRVGL
jgi:predicted O-linked N-acetylglucosamine transferase (SPINDLY family)